MWVPFILSVFGLFFKYFYLKVMLCFRKILVHSETVYIKVLIFGEKKFDQSRDQPGLPDMRNTAKTGKRLFRLQFSWHLNKIAQKPSFNDS